MTASRLIRFFSRRQPKKLHEETHPQVTSIKNGLVCTIIFLDGENVNFEIDRKALAKNLYEKTITHLKLIESDYFGLQFTDPHNVKQWLDPSKSVKKQCKIGPPYTFRFRVKFYTSDPQNLHDELTRYLFVLQLKSDIRTGKLDCPPDTDVELAALTMQAELGDCTADEHSIDNISELRFLPDDRQTEEFEEQVLQLWSTYKGFTPADCEMQYLNKARWLEMYGVDLHTVMGKDGFEYKLGLTPTGILVFENQVKIGLFVWSKVTRIDFNRSKLTIIVVEDDDNDPHLQRDFVFLFRCHDEKQCKQFWKCALEYHVFFRTTSGSKVKQGSKSNFARTGSRFRFSGRTECQTATWSHAVQEDGNFERKASQRFSRRASYAIRKRIQEQETFRELEDERVRKLKVEQETKLEENKKAIENKSTGNHELPSNTKRLSSSQKTLSLSATQRLDNLIQGPTNDVLAEETEARRNSTNLLSGAPVVPPRQSKSEDKTTLIISPTKESSNGHHQVEDDTDQTLLIQLSPQKSSVVPTNGHYQTNSSRPAKTNSAPSRYTLAPSSQPISHTNKETYEIRPNQMNKSKPIQLINGRSSSSQLPPLHSRIIPRSSTSSGTFPSHYSQVYHPITTEL